MNDDKYTINPETKPKLKAIKPKKKITTGKKTWSDKSNMFRSKPEKKKLSK